MAKAGKSAEIGDDSIDRRLVELEVARVQHVSSWAAEENADRTRNRMIDRKELGLEAPKLNDIARFDFYELSVLDLMFLELALNETKRHLRAVNRHGHVQILVEIGQTARMVLMTVR